MKIPFPKTKSEYPFYILFYWIICWGFLFLYSSFIIISSLTSDGRFVEKTECLQKKNTECIKYDRPYYVAVGTELKYSFVQIGFYSGVVTIGTGILLAILSSNRKRS